jgi:hypothetical protein
VWNYKTKLGYFEDSTGFTNQTNDGTVIYFTAERVERISLDEIVNKKGKFHCMRRGRAEMVVHCRRRPA